MKVAWLTHRPWEYEAGGAEACDIDMVKMRPSDTELTVMRPGGVNHDLLDFDRIVVTGFYGFSRVELSWIKQRADRTILWLHDSQMKGHWLYEIARYLVFSSPQHKAHDLKGMSYRGETVVNPGYMDVDSMMKDLENEHYVGRTNALWAHRPVAHKGLDLAAEWAKEKGVTLDVLVGRPRAQVLRAMAQHQYFVLLSHIFDACPRSVMEAQLLGCELVINENVGWFNESSEELSARLKRAGDEFWKVVQA